MLNFTYNALTRENLEKDAPSQEVSSIVGTIFTSMQIVIIAN